MRAFRVDKMTLAALEATLRLYLDPEKALQAIPHFRMLEMPLAVVQERGYQFHPSGEHAWRAGACGEL